jgi:DNA-binding NarL/FixJ family response regulator
VVVADEDRPLRQLIRNRLVRTGGVIVVGEVPSASLAVSLVDRVRAHVVVTDLQPTPADALGAIRLLTDPWAWPRVGVVVLTRVSTGSTIVAAVEAGALGYLLKSRDSAHLAEAVQRAARQELTVSPSVDNPAIRRLVARVRSQAAGRPGPRQLTPGERAVVEQLSAGRTTDADIALRLHRSVVLVSAQVQSSLRKTGLADREQLALWGIRLGLGRRWQLR